mmetsp:Transcript_14228/g.20454  ORF Transcript_14228/g.20454 Transcript_14228/m.20454 type:complete len:132 (+) Transcript_14228:1-396(+)
MGASCLGAITKRFGALSMALTSTARKATTLFLSFALFNNNCTSEHVMGVSLFLTGLIMKAFNRRSSFSNPSSSLQTAGEKPEEQTTNKSWPIISKAKQLIEKLPNLRKHNDTEQLLRSRSCVDTELGVSSP